MKKTLLLVLIILFQQTGLIARGGWGAFAGGAILGTGIGLAASHHDRDYYDRPIVVMPEQSTRYADRAVNEDEGEYISNEEETPVRTHATKRTKEPDTKFHSSSNYAQEPTIDDGDGEETESPAAVSENARVVYEDEE